MKIVKVVYEHKAECIYEPRGDNGLEGFILGEIYKIEKIAIHSKIHFRVCLNPEYYETCGPIIFKRYFNEIEEEE